MSNISLKDILKTKKVGERWLSFMAPEEYKIWDLKTHKVHWTPLKFRKMGIELNKVLVSGSREIENDITKWNKKSPLMLPESGKIINQGREVRAYVRRHSYCIAVEGVADLNKTLRELSARTNVSSWKVKSIEVTNPKEEALCRFSIFSPNGTGADLHLERVIIGNQNILFSEISYADQLRYCAEFRRSNYSACEKVKGKAQPTTACTIKNLFTG